MRLVAAEAGFLPPGPEMDFADIMANESPSHLIAFDQSRYAAIAVLRVLGVKQVLSSVPDTISVQTWNAV